MKKHLLLMTAIAIIAAGCSGGGEEPVSSAPAGDATSTAAEAGKAPGTGAPSTGPTPTPMGG